MREDRWKYILDLRAGTEELFDLNVDADEQHSIADEHPDVASRLRRRLAAWTESNRRQYIDGHDVVALASPPQALPHPAGQ